MACTNLHYGPKPVQTTYSFSVQLPSLACYTQKLHFSNMYDGPTDQQTDESTAGRIHILIEMCKCILVHTGVECVTACHLKLIDIPGYEMCNCILSSKTYRGMRCVTASKAYRHNGV